ncbi:hypothetical protein TWF481_003179 [Arthrobotrys musiformis]|uniref:BTB domain-containing protein n=1 Tax=Arthrobotrys musiformis TaxID=47236 RepID=A0AAV9VPG8_9PEZI
MDAYMNDSSDELEVAGARPGSVMSKLGSKKGSAAVVPANSNGASAAEARAGTILSLMLESGDYSDITVFAGPDRVPFKLHRAVICQTSDFFKAACKHSFKEGNTKEIYLREIDPSTFRWIADWQYGKKDKYNETWTSGREELGIFKAADFLQIKRLRSEILESLTKSCREKLRELKRPRAYPTYPERKGVTAPARPPDIDAVADEVWANFAKICDISHQEDLDALISIAAEILPHRGASANEIIEGLASGVYGSTFVAAVVGAQNVILHVYKMGDDGALEKPETWRFSDLKAKQIR